MRVERHHEQPVVEHAEAAVHRAAAVGEARRRQLAAVAPDLTAGARVERPCVVVRAGHVQHAVDEDRRRFEAAERLGLEAPLRHETVHVLRRDLHERTVALAAVVAAVHQPSRRILQAGDERVAGNALR